MILLRSVLIPCARLILALEPVARTAEPYSVPKNQYSTPIMTIQKPAKTAIVIPLLFSCVIIREYFRAGSAWFACPIIFRFTDHSINWVRIPDKIAGIPINVWNIPVTSPVSIPTSIATNIASHTFQPWIINIAHTAMPVQIEPSTVRSAKSNIL